MDYEPEAIKRLGRYCEVLAVVLREMTAYASGWRNNWSDFDGRTLRDQLRGLASWAKKMTETGAAYEDYREGTDFYEHS